MLEGVTETEARGFVQNGGSVVAAVRPGPAQVSVSRNLGLRPALRAHLDQQQLACPDTILIEELGLCQGLARIDLATVSGVLHGYEIKSNRDRLSRLASQAETYSPSSTASPLLLAPSTSRLRSSSFPGGGVCSWFAAISGESRSIRSVLPLRISARIRVRWSSCFGATRPWNCLRATMLRRVCEASRDRRCGTECARCSIWLRFGQRCGIGSEPGQRPQRSRDFGDVVHGSD